MDENLRPRKSPNRDGMFASAISVTIALVFSEVWLSTSLEGGAPVAHGIACTLLIVLTPWRLPGAVTWAIISPFRWNVFRRRPRDVPFRSSIYVERS